MHNITKPPKDSTIIKSEKRKNKHTNQMVTQNTKVHKSTTTYSKNVKTHIFRKFVKDILVRSLLYKTDENDQILK